MFIVFYDAFQSYHLMNSRNFSWIRDLLLETNSLVSVPSKRVSCMLPSDFRDINIKEIVEMIIEFAIQIMNLKKMAVEFSIFFLIF